VKFTDILSGGRLFGAMGALLLFFLPIALGIFNQHIMIMVIFFAFCATAWNLLSGFVGALSLGHATFLGLGAYISTLLYLHIGLTPWIGMFVGAVITAIFGVIIGFPCFRLTGPYFVLTTIALGEMIRLFIESNEFFLGIEIMGAMGLLLPSSFDPAYFRFGSRLAYYYIMLAFLVVALYISYRVKNSKLGYYLIAIKSDPDAAASLGINLTRYKLIAMGLSCFLMAFAGTFYAQYFLYVGPTRVFGGDLSVQIALIAMIGGQGTIFGPLFGAVLLVPVAEWITGQFGGSLPGLHLFIYGVAMMLIVLYKPAGIHDTIVRVFTWLQDKLLSPFVKKEKV